jgi:hypothetical protein
MSKVENQYFLEHRVKALANVFLMGRNSIATYQIPDFGDIDLMARVLPEGEEYEKLFGVILKGTPGPLPSEREAASFLRQWDSHRKYVHKFPFPVLILVFSMRDDDGYFAWEFEPYLNYGEPVLKHCTEFKVERTTKRGLDAITRALDAWYTKFYTRFML